MNKEAAGAARATTLLMFFTNSSSLQLKLFYFPAMTGMRNLEWHRQDDSLMPARLKKHFVA